MDTDRASRRRALELRNNASRLRQEADRESNGDRRTHLLDLAESNLRAADVLARQPTVIGQSASDPMHD